MTDAAGADGALYFLPLGGTDEIGMNLYLYGVDDRWLMVDLGVGFGDEATPGIEIMMPDPDFIAERREDLVGIVLTHAHEDHFGAIQYLWPRLRCPIYATPFTARFLRLKLNETDFGDRVQIIEVPLGGRIELGPFTVDFVSMTHSIPEPNALAIGTRHGTVVHSGDWKLDPQPLLGGPTEEDRLRRLGSEGVLAVICDSTNALEPGHSGSEAGVAEALQRVIAAQPHRVAVGCFATNVARVQSIARAAHAAGRNCALVGRSLWRLHEAARLSGYLDVPEPFLTESDVGYIPRDKIVMICTGSQGEPRAALTRIAQDDHPRVTLEAGDTVIFSSREIPGNEKAIARTQNLLARRGIDVITPHQEPGIHVSGHPARDELAQLYQWLRPRIAVPMHGEPRHLLAHAELARDCQIADVVVPENGAMIRLAPGAPGIADRVATGRLAMDGTRLIRLDGGAVRTRRRMTHSGAAVVTVVLAGDGRVAGDPQVALLGIEDGDELLDSQEAVADEVRTAVQNLSKAQRRDDDTVRETARVTLRRAVRTWHGKRPLTEVHLVRLQGDVT